MSTDLSITFKDKVYPIPEGFTAVEFKDSLASQFPEAATADLIDDGEGKYTLKTTFKQKG
jgi:hypothetical protein